MENANKFSPAFGSSFPLFLLDLGPTDKQGEPKSTRNRQSFEESNKIGIGLGPPSSHPAGKGSVYEGTLYADQQVKVNLVLVSSLNHVSRLNLILEMLNQGSAIYL